MCGRATLIPPNVDDVSATLVLVSAHGPGGGGVLFQPLAVGAHQLLRSGLGGGLGGAPSVLTLAFKVLLLPGDVVGAREHGPGSAVRQPPAVSVPRSVPRYPVPLVQLHLEGRIARGWRLRTPGPRPMHWKTRSMCRQSEILPH